MAQHDYNIEDQNGFDFLVDLNNALSAIATNNAGSSEPNTTFPHMLWFDTNNDLMKMRNQANSAWVVVAKKDGSGWTPYRQGTALGTASVRPDWRYAHRDNNLSDLESAATARGNLGVADDSSDPDFTNNPNAAARRGLVLSALLNVLNATGTAPLYACRAWVNFKGTGTLSIRASGNVSSITDVGVGNYRINFAIDMEDANYSAVISHGFDATPSSNQNNTGAFQRQNLAGSFTLFITSVSDYNVDASQVMVSIFR